jgi:hypothetical protein
MLGCRCLTAVGFGRPGLAVGQLTLPVGFARLAMCIEELRRVLVHLGGPLVNGGCLLICRGVPTPVLLVRALAVCFAHHLSLSRDVLPV